MKHSPCSQSNRRCSLEMRSAWSDFISDLKSFLPKAPAFPEMGIWPPSDNTNFGPGPVVTGVVCGVPSGTRVVHGWWLARVLTRVPEATAAGLLARKTTAPTAAAASKPSNRMYSSVGLTGPSSPPKPRVKIPPVPESPVPALATADPLLV